MTYRKDKLEVIDEQENVISIEERGKIHKEGLLHREVHVWFYTQAGELILQHRGLNVETFPDMFDATVGGHVEIGDSLEETAVKESEEETGLRIDPKDLVLLDKFINISQDTLNQMTNKSLKVEYAYLFKGNIDELAVEKGKCIGFELWPIEKLLNPDEIDVSKFVKAIFDNENFQNVFRKIQQLWRKEESEKRSK